MTDTPIPFYRTPISRKQIAAVVRTLKSGWLTTGAVCHELERRLAEYLGVKHAVGVNSCTAGLHLALLATGTGEGDEVITTPFTFIASVETIVHAGATPVFADIDFNTFNIDPGEIEKKITKKTRAIMPVHVAGLPCEMDSIRELANKHNLVIIHDAAHAIGSEYKGTKIGAIPDISSFSFYATKNITTGEGGLITTDRDEWADELRVLRLHGMDKHAWKRYQNSGSWYYEVKRLGYKYNLADLNASIGLAQLDVFDKLQDARRRAAQWYDTALSRIDEVLLPPRHEHSIHAWHLYMIRLRNESLSISRNEIIEQLRDAGVGTSVHFIPAFKHPYYRDNFDLDESEYPEANRLYECILTLPFFPGIKKWETTEVVERLGKIISKHKRK